MAWAQNRGISKVEVQLNGGDWKEARLALPISQHTWVQWVHEWDATPGSHVARVRATEANGEAATRESPGPQRRMAPKAGIKSDSTSLTDERRREKRRWRGPLDVSRRSGTAQRRFAARCAPAHPLRAHPRIATGGLGRQTP